MTRILMKIIRCMRSITTAAAMISIGVLVIGILLNAGAWSIPGVVGLVVFGILRYSVFGTTEEKNERGIPAEVRTSDHEISGGNRWRRK